MAKNGAGNECFVDDRAEGELTYDYLPTLQDNGKKYEDTATNANTRGQWMKCLPPYLVIISQAIKDGTRSVYKDLIELYNELKLWHDQLCTHLYVDITDDELMVPLTEAILGIGDYTNDKVRSLFLRSFTQVMNRYLRRVMEFDQVTACAENALGTVDIIENGQEKTVPNYIKRTLYFNTTKNGPNKYTDSDGKDYFYPDVGIQQIVMGLEEVNSNYTARFEQCPQDYGAACLWIINERQYKRLPADQRAGFHNTQLHANISDLFEADTFEGEARVGLRRNHFTNESEDFSVFLLDQEKADRINAQKGFYIHAHMAYGGDAFMRVFSYQHVAERLYPGKVFKTCFCDFRKLAQVVEQTDCTYNYTQNNQCKTNGSNKVADANGWFLDPVTEEPVRSEQGGALLCCRNCDNGPQCQNKYDTPLENA